MDATQEDAALTGHLFLVALPCQKVKSQGFTLSASWQSTGKSFRSVGFVISRINSHQLFQGGRSFEEFGVQCATLGAAGGKLFAMRSCAGFTGQ